MGGSLIRVLHFSDLHLGIEAHGRPDPATGINRRVLDVAERLDEIVEYALGTEIDLVLFAGDAFKNATPHPTLQKILAERVRRLTKGGVRVFLLAGNHDLPRMTANVTAFSVYSALEAEHVWTAERPGVYRIPLRDDRVIQVAAIPHFWPRAVAEEFRAEGTDVDPDFIAHQVVAQKVRELGDAVDRSMPAVLTAHLEIKGAKRTDSQDRYDTTEVRVQPGALVHEAFGYVALGHIHDVEQKFDRGETYIRYAGSVERVDFGEEKDRKGFYVVSFDGTRVTTEPEFVELHPRRFLTIDAGVGEDPTASTLEAIGKFDVSDAIVRLRVRAERDRFNLIDTRRVYEALGAAYESSLLCVPPEDTPSVGQDPRFAEQMTEKQALAEFVRSAYPKDAPALIALGSELIDEVAAEA